jgi:hypothetical protein
MKPEKAQRRLAETQREIAEIDGRIAQLEAAQAAEEAAQRRSDNAAELMARITPSELEAMEPAALDLLRESNPTAYRAMGERLVRYRPARAIQHQMEQSLARPEMTVEPLAAEDLAAAVATAGPDGVLDYATLARLDESQLAAVKGTELWHRSMQKLAALGDKPVAYVV